VGSYVALGRFADSGLVMGGMLADPVKSYPRLFGPNSSFGGENGVQWLERYPYALPMLANFFFLCTCAGLVGYGLEEVRTIILKN
jgi:hypothetical protein